jgi:ribonuclease HI
MKIYCDGGSRGNPGPAASAFVVFDEKDELVHKESKYLGVTTNNVAEYNAVLLATKWLVEPSTVKSKKSTVIVNLDSQLVERQLNGFYKIKNENLMKFALEIKNIIKVNNLNLKFIWNYRTNNKLADKLVNDILDDVQRENKQ